MASVKLQFDAAPAAPARFPLVCPCGCSSPPFSTPLFGWYNGASGKMGPNVGGNPGPEAPAGLGEHVGIASRGSSRCLAEQAPFC